MLTEECVFPKGSDTSYLQKLNVSFKKHADFVEVKTSRYYDHNVFDLSYFEWDFLSREPPVQYRIYRVSGAAEAAGPRVSVIHDVLRAVKEGSARLCLAI